MFGMGKPKLPKCANKPCRKDFVPRTAWQRFCTNKCHEEHHCREKREKRAASANKQAS